MVISVKKVIFKYSVLMAFICLFIALGESNVKAFSYNDTCNGNILKAESNNYYECGDNAIYLMNDKNKSSFIIANANDMNISNKVLYAGNVNGIETFYASAFYFYAVVYDDRPFLGYGEDAWADVSINGEIVYSGAFENSFLVNKSSQKLLPLYNEIGTYIIRQYVSSEVINIIKVIVPNENESGLDVSKVTYDGIDINSVSTTNKYGDITFYINGGLFGFSNEVNIKINSCEIVKNIDSELTLKNSEFVDCLNYNLDNKISINIANGLNVSETFTYSFVINCKNVLISLESSVAKDATSSRRIVIKATPGKGKTLDESNSLYYWSTREDDKLTYEDFITNYENSERKGKYSSNKGVILRNSVGTYYLYALAKDDDSYIVVRSEKYELYSNHSVNKIIVKDFIIVGILCIAAAIPVFIYIFVRGKDTD